MRKNILKCLIAVFAIVLCLTGCVDSSTLHTENAQQTTPIENTAYVEPSEALESTVPNDTNTQGWTEPEEPVVEETKDAEPTEETTNIPEASDTGDTDCEDPSEADQITDGEIEETEIVEPTEVVEPSDDELVNIVDYIPNIIIDLKYATEDNFTGIQIYESDMPAMLRYGTVKKLMEVQTRLNYLGYTLVVWDAYRPTSAQFKLWDVCPNSTYVANPYTGFSSHSRGNTVDITILTEDGKLVEMPTGFDDFSQAANRNYGDVSEEAATNATMLEIIMEDCGFKPYYGEWWHFSDTTKYDVVQD